MAFGSGTTGPGDELDQAAVSGVASGQQDKPWSISQRKFAADDQGQSTLPCGNVRPDDSGYAALIGQSQRPVTEIQGLSDQFLGM